MEGHDLSVSATRGHRALRSIRNATTPGLPPAFQWVGSCGMERLARGPMRLQTSEGVSCRCTWSRPDLQARLSIAMQVTTATHRYG